MAATLIQRRGPARADTRAGLAHPTRHRWETRNYDLTKAGRQAGARVDEPGERVSRLAGGYNRLARDFDHALHLAGLDGLQHVLVYMARRASWTSSQIDGTNKPRPFRLNFSAIAGSMEKRVRPNLSAQCAALVSARIFADVGDGSHLINKDYRKWVRPDGSPLLSEKQIGECLAIRRRCRTVAKSDSPLQPGSPDRREKRHLLSRKATPPVAKSDSPLQPDQRHKVNPDEALESKSGVASIGTRAESFRERENCNRDAGEAESEQVSRWAADRVARAYPSDDSLIELIPLQVIAWIRDEGYRPADVQAAIQKAIDRPCRPSGLFAYVNSILASPRALPRIDHGHSPEPPARTTKADRNSARLAQQREAARRVFGPKGGDDGEGV